MFRVDPMQFSKKNKMLFQEGSWFIFLDLADFTKDPEEYIPRLAHRCNQAEREKYGPPYKWNKRHTCCLVMVDNQVCKDCHAATPEVFQGFFNLADWSFNG